MATLSPSDVLDTASDNCTDLADLVFTLSKTSFTCADAGNTSVTLTARDACGNENSCNATVTVSTPSCTITLNEDGNCGNMNMGTATVLIAGGRAPYTILWDSGEMTATATMLGGTVAGTEHTVMVTDASGCTTSCTVTIRGEDPCCTPVATCDLSNETVTGCSISDLPSPYTDYTDVFNVTEACGFTPVLRLESQSSATGEVCTAPGIQVDRNYILSIDGTDVAACMHTISIIDDENPVVICSDIEVDLMDDGTVSISNGDIIMSMTDNCTAEGDLDVDLSVSSFDCSNVGDNTVTVTITDQCGNEHSCDATVTVNGLDAPNAGDDGSTVLCNAEYPGTRDLQSLLSGAPMSGGLWVETSTTPSGVSLLLPSQANFTAIPAGSYTYRYSVTNACGASDNADLTVEVEDCFDLALRKTISTSGSISSGDNIEFEIEVFNQGDVDAYDVVVRDYLTGLPLTFSAADNTSVLTGNDNNWSFASTAPATDIETVVDFIAAGSSAIIKLFTTINTGQPTFTFTNEAEIIFATNRVGGVEEMLDEDRIGISSGGGIAVIEDDDNIDDDSNGGSDNPMDRDEFDLARVSNCLLSANDYSETVCSDPNSNEAIFNLNSTTFTNAIGGGTGLTLTYHVNQSQAEAGAFPLSGIYQTASTVIFARLADENDSDCYDISTITLNVLEAPIIISQPEGEVICEIPDILNFEVVSSTPGVTYIWESSLSGGPWTPVFGQTTNQLPVPVNAGYVPLRYRAVITFTDPISGMSCSTVSREVSVVMAGDEEDMVCNDLIQVSVDAFCSAELVADQVLENMQLSSNQYDVIYEDANGNLIENYDIGSYASDSVVYKVINKCTGLYCWGHVLIEDKISPELYNCNDVIIPCEMDYAPDDLLGNPLFSQFAYPDVSDNCGATTLEYSDAPAGQMCEMGFAFGIQRTWVVTDASGNSNSCVQHIYVDRVEVSEIVWPDDYLPDYNQNSNCSLFDIVGIDPAISGQPSGYTCPNLNFSFTDTEFELCGASTKVLRNWVALDWCSGEIAEYGQNMEVYDDEPPVIKCGPTCITLYTDPYTCSASYTFPIPVKDDESINPDDVTYADCSDVSWKIFYGVVPAEYDLGNPTDPCAEDFNDAPITYTQVTPNTSGEYVVDGIPEGLVWFKYEFIDACGNLLSESDPNFCTKDVIILDGSAPEAICESFTKTTLDASGRAVILAESFDDGSFDRCEGDLTFEVKRIGSTCTGFESDLVYGSELNFCCMDVGNDSIPVMLKVTDAAGNFDECTGYVCVTDPEPFTITCNDGPFYTTCDKYISDYVFPEPSENFLCAIPLRTEVTYDSTGISACGTGVAFRITKYINNQTNFEVGECRQELIVDTDFTLSSGNIQCPNDVDLPACDVEFTPEILNSFPTILSSPSCSQLAISYEDGEPFTDNGNPACYSVIRTWTIIDWCVYNPANPTIGRFTCVQAINFNSAQGPEFTSGCTDVMVVDEDNDCEHLVTMSVTATDADGCTQDNDLIYWYDIDVDNNNSIDISDVPGNDATSVYPVGTHEITFYVQDGCGNINSCSHLFTVQNDLGPDPICRAELIWGLDADGQTEVWASDFDLSSVGGCNTTLSFSFTEDGNTPALSFDCDDIENGMVDTIMLQMYVLDGAGPPAFCDVLLILQDNLDVCPDHTSANGSGRIAGMILNESHEGVENFEVRLENMSTANMEMEMTEEDGSFAFDEPELYDDYSIKPYHDKDHQQGVSTLDIILIQRHILNIQSLDSPYKIIAADANLSYSISAADIVDIRKLILGINEDYPSNTSWQFVSNTTDFIDPAHPWDYKSSHDIHNHLLDVNDAEFIAVKVGDVNNSVWISLNDDSAELRSGNTMNLYTNEQQFGSSQSLNIPFYSASAESLYGLQYTLKFDPQVVRFEELTSSVFNLDETSINTNFIADGLLTVSVNLVNSIDLQEDQELFNLKLYTLEADKLSNNLEMSSEITEAIAVNGELETSSLDINIIDVNQKDESMNDLVVFQNEPNPFSESTKINYQVNAPTQEVELTVFDADGRVVYYESQVPNPGENSFTLFKQNLGASGMLYYKVEANSSSVVNRMIILD